jgi:hypothetical protein
MDKQLCAGQTRKGERYFRTLVSCQNEGTLEHNGQMWCKVHHRPTLDAKQKAKTEALKEKWHAELRQRKAERMRAALAERALDWMRLNEHKLVTAWEKQLNADQ